MGVFFDRLDSLQQTFQDSIMFIVLVCLWLLFVGISIYYAINCFIPRMELKYDNNVFFFSDAVRKYGDIHQFSKTYCKICNNEKLLYDQLSQQVYIGSKIIDHKFKSVQKSVKYLAYRFYIRGIVVSIMAYNVVLVPQIFHNSIQDERLQPS